MSLRTGSSLASAIDIGPAVITGAAGCVGHALAVRLASVGGPARLSIRESIQRTGAPSEVVVGDLHIPAVRRALLRDARVLFHCAAFVHRSAENPIDRAACFSDNLDLTRALVDDAREAGVERVVLVSTVAVYGDGPVPHPLQENDPCHPQTAYGESKLAAERVVLDAGGVVVRLPMVYGPRDRGNMARLIRAIDRGYFVEVASPHRRSVVAAANAAEAIRLAGNTRQSRVYNVADDHRPTLHEMVTSVATHLGRRLPVPSVPRRVLTPVAAIGSWLRRLGVPAPLDRERLRKLLEGPVIDTTVARSELGFRDVTDMDAGLAEEVRWYRGRQ